MAMMLQSPMPYGADLFDIAPTSPTHHHSHSHGHHHAGHLQATSPTAAAGASSKKSSIDQSKLKTKLCRHYLMGLPCPFESRCAFAHGEEQLQDAHNGSSSRGGVASGSSSTGAMSPVSPIAASTAGAGVASSSSLSMRPPAYVPAFAPRAAPIAAPFDAPAPPSYHAFVSQSMSVSGNGSEADNESPRVSRPPSPPAYPTRFRYEPYSQSAIVFQA